MIYNDVQKQIARRIEEKLKLSNWKDWRWQLRHSIKSLDKFERLTGIKFEEKEKDGLVKTFLRFNYNYSGTLIKNTNIAGNIESMNVYYKHI